MRARPCSYLKCPNQATIRVYYLTELGQFTAKSWARVCGTHALAVNFTYGTILRRETLKC